MPRKRISIIWTTSKEKFAEICKSSKTMKEALSFFGLKNKGGNFRTFKKRVEEEGIDTSHFLARHPASMLSRRRAISEILVKNRIVIVKRRHSLVETRKTFRSVKRLHRKFS